MEGWDLVVEGRVREKEVVVEVERGRLMVLAALDVVSVVAELVVEVWRRRFGACWWEEVRRERSVRLSRDDDGETSSNSGLGGGARASL